MSRFNKLRVLLTRSLEENQDIINNYGDKFNFVNCNLVQYKDFLTVIKTALTEFDQFIITSKHAAKLVAAEIIKSNKKRHFYIVGKLSAQILKNAGGDVRFVGENSNELIKYIPISEYKNTVYLSGTFITTNFSSDVKRIIIYNIKYRDTLSQTEINEIKNGLNYILVFSANSANILIKLLIKYNLIENIIDTTTIIAISQNVEKIVRLYFKNIIYCKRGQYNKMMQILIEDAVLKN